MAPIRDQLLLLLAITAALMFLFLMGMFMPVRAEVYITHTLVCDDTKKFEAELLNKYDEHQVAGGIDGKGNLVRVFSSDKTWTIMRTSPNGLSCTFDAGENWETLTPEIKGKKT